ncbi:MAG: Hsp20/alpha crystallin family protein [Vulcanimicrobiota bacterium]
MAEKRKTKTYKQKETSLRDGAVEHLTKIYQAMHFILTDLFHDHPGLHFEPAIDLFENNGFLILEMEIPGVDPDDLNLRVEATSVKLRGEILTSEDFDSENAIINERFYGPFKTTIGLPLSVDPSLTEAYYLDGILRVEMTVDEEEEYLPGAAIEIQ